MEQYNEYKQKCHYCDGSGELVGLNNWHGICDECFGVGYIEYEPPEEVQEQERLKYMAAKEQGQ